VHAVGVQHVPFTHGLLPQGLPQSTVPPQLFETLPHRLPHVAGVIGVQHDPL
jgi:hypothetical protein